MRTLFSTFTFVAVTLAARAEITGGVTYTYTGGQMPMLCHAFEAQPLRMALTNIGIESQFNGWLYTKGPMAPGNRAMRFIRVHLNGVMVNETIYWEAYPKTVEPNVTYCYTITESMLKVGQPNYVVFTQGWYGGGGSPSAVQTWEIRGTYYRS